LTLRIFRIYYEQQGFTKISLNFLNHKNMNFKNTRSILFLASILIPVILASFILTSKIASGDAPLIFGGDIDNAPYSFESADIPQGYSIALMKLLTATIEKNISIRLMPWEKCLEEIKAGRIDGLIGTPALEKWKDFMDYSEPLRELEYAIFVETKNHHIDSIKSLEGAVVGVCEKSYIIDELEKNKRLTLVKTRTILDAFRKLENKEIMAVIAEKNTGLCYTRLAEIRDLMVVSPIVDLIYPYSIAVRKGDRKLLNDINRGIADLKARGSLRRLNIRWFGTYLIKPIPWKPVVIMSSKITGVLLLLLIILWIVSLNATVKVKTQQVELMSRKMIEKEKLAVLGKIAGQIAHELRTPLGIIKNLVYLLHKDELTDRESFKKRLHMLEEKIKLTSNILESVLSYSRVKADVPSQISTEECLNEVLKDLGVRKGIKVNISTDTETPPTVFMDFHQLYSVLRNMLLNAIQSIDDTGTLTVKTFFSDHDNKVNIRICDTGRGIDENAKNKVFNLFYSDKITGTGLGLPISKSIVETNNGELRLENTSNKGSCFIITLPSSKTE